MSDPVTVTPSTWRGRPAWLVAGRRLEAVLTATGCHLACLRRRGHALNPLWQPHWPSGDPRRAAADGTWGVGPEAPLLAGIAGSNLCIDRFGDPWPGEDKPVHGEGGIATWRPLAAPPGLALFTTRLPIARLEVRRGVRFAGDRLELVTAVRHEGPDAREVEWCEHTTIGDPFLAGARFTAGIDAAWTGARPQPGPDGETWPALAPLPLETALRVPHPDDPPWGAIATSRVADGWWQAENPLLGWRLRAEFDPRHFPWIALWTQHRERRGAPWLGRERTRGMEMTTKPIPEGRPPAERARHWQGRPTICSLAPHRWHERTVTFTWEELATAAGRPAPAAKQRPAPGRARARTATKPAASGKPKAGAKKPKAVSKKPKAVSREPKAGAKKPKAPAKKKPARGR